MLFRMESEIPPTVQLRLKLEINCFEHFTQMGLVKFPFRVNSQWFEGKCELTTYHLEELLGTKLRALYQRKRGRDLFDLYVALTQKNPNLNDIMCCYNRYMTFTVEQPPTYKQFIQNMDEKMQDADFLNDSQMLLRPELSFNAVEAYSLIKNKLIGRLKK